MNRTVRWTRRALRRLEEIGDYIAKENPDAAEQVVDSIATQILYLRQKPSIGRHGRIDGTRELVITGTNYIVAYRVHGNDLEILTILHGAQQWPRAL